LCTDDYRPSFNIKLNCQAVKVKLLTLNTILKSQPLDQGIIKTFKTLYRKKIMRKIISGMDDNKSTTTDVFRAKNSLSRIFFLKP